MAKKMAFAGHLWPVLALMAVVCAAVFFGGCRKEEGEEAGPSGGAKITGKNVVMVIASQGFRDEELSEPKSLIEKAGGKVVVASSSLNTATGMLGKKVKPDVLLKDVKADDFDAVVFVGGAGASEYWNDATAHSLAKDAVRKGKLVCAICIAPVTLANAGVLDGKRATVWKSEASKLEAKGAKYTGKDVQVDGKIITANGPPASKAFGREIVKALSK